MEKYYIPEQKKESAATTVLIREVSTADLPTAFGFFKLRAFAHEETEEEYITLIHGELEGKEHCPVRVHSQCFTGDVLGSLRCDCRDQLIASLKYIQKHPFGLLIYLKQEGRGIGLLNKIRAYHLQDRGYDTVDANRTLGLPDDTRDYSAAAQIINLFGIRSVSLLTNNPLKVSGLRENGVKVAERIALHIEPNDHNKFYLFTKKNRMGHLF
jgi:GTP cyclohydrolase II